MCAETSAGGAACAAAGRSGQRQRVHGHGAGTAAPADRRQRTGPRRVARRRPVLLHALLALRNVRLFVIFSSLSFVFLDLHLRLQTDRLAIVP